MSRVFIATGAALFAGLIIGGGAAAVLLNGRVTTAERERQAIASEYEVAKSRNAELSQINDNLIAREQDLEQRLASLQQQLKDARTAAAATPMEVSGGTEEVETAAVFDELFDAIQAEPEAAPERETRRWGDDDDGPDREEMEQRRREAFRVARERMDEFMQDSIANAGSATEQQRLAAIRDNVNYMSELMQQARQVESEADREAYREAIMETREVVQGLVREQQNSMMREVAASHGIKDPKEQDAFIDALRETQSSPYFRAPGLVMGGWGWDRGRGRGDGDGR